METIRRKYHRAVEHKLTIRHVAKKDKGEEGFSLYVEIIVKKQNTRFISKIREFADSAEELFDNTIQERKEDVKLIEFIINSLNYKERENFKVTEILNVYKWTMLPVSMLTEHLLKEEYCNENGGVIAKEAIPDSFSKFDTYQVIYYMNELLDFKTKLFDKYKSNIWLLETYEKRFSFDFVKKNAKRSRSKQPLDFINFFQFIKGDYQKNIMPFFLTDDTENSIIEDIKKLLEANRSDLFELLKFR